MKQLPDPIEPTASDTDEKAPAQQEPDTAAIQQALEALTLDVQAETGKHRIRFPFGDETWP